VVNEVSNLRREGGRESRGGVVSGDKWNAVKGRENSKKEQIVN